MSLALQVSQIRSNGYFKEPHKPVKLLDHYHHFLFYMNITKLESSYLTLKRNGELFQYSPMDKLTNKIHLHLHSNIKMIEQILNKLNYHRSKRGLINALGSVIKFIAGNPDDNDLQMINENLQTLRENQNAEISKLNQLTSFANHISKRYAEDIHFLNENIKSTEKLFQNLSNIMDFRVALQNEIYLSENLLNQLLILERTISLALNDIPNLEIIRVNEFITIHKYLEETYNPKQLMPYDNVHLFNILQSAKLVLIGVDQAIAFLLKIPILKPFFANYSTIYPIPNRQDIVIVPPKKHLIELNGKQFWTNEECRSFDSIILCIEEPLQSNCSLDNLSSCLTAKVLNNYKITHILKNSQLLAIFKDPSDVIEDCHGTVSKHSIKGPALISSKCRIIIDTSSFINTIPRFEIPVINISEIDLKFNHEAKLFLKHLQNPENLMEEAIEIETTPIHLRPLTHIVHYGLSIATVISLIILAIIVYKYRGRIADLFCRSRRIIVIKKEEKKNEDNKNKDKKNEEDFHNP